MLAIIPKQLGQLREVDVSTEALLDGLPVKMESIGGELNPVRCAAVQIVTKGLRVLTGTLPNKKHGYQFCISIEGHENPLVAKLGPREWVFVRIRIPGRVASSQNVTEDFP